MCSSDLVFWCALCSVSQSRYSGAGAYLGLAKAMLEENLFLESADDIRTGYSEFEILSCMERNILNNVQWKDDQWGTEIVGLKDPAAARSYIEQVPMLGALSERMGGLGWTNRGARKPQEYVDKILTHLSAIDKYLKTISSPFN